MRKKKKWKPLFTCLKPLFFFFYTNTIHKIKGVYDLDKLKRYPRIRNFFSTAFTLKSLIPVSVAILSIYKGTSLIQSVINYLPFSKNSIILLFYIVFTVFLMKFIWNVPMAIITERLSIKLHTVFSFMSWKNKEREPKVEKGSPHAIPLNLEFWWTKTSPEDQAWYMHKLKQEKKYKTIYNEFRKAYAEKLYVLNLIKFRLECQKTELEYYSAREMLIKAEVYLLKKYKRR